MRVFFPSHIKQRLLRRAAFRARVEHAKRVREDKAKAKKRSGPSSPKTRHTIRLKISPDKIPHHVNQQNYQNEIIIFLNFCIKIN